MEQYLRQKITMKTGIFRIFALRRQGELIESSVLLKVPEKGILNVEKRLLLKMFVLKFCGIELMQSEIKLCWYAFYVGSGTGRLRKVHETEVDVVC